MACGENLRERAGLEVFGGVHVGDDQGVVDRHVLDALAVAVLDLARVGGQWGAQEGVEHLPAGKQGMSVALAIAGHDRPGAARRGLQELLAQQVDGLAAGRRTVHQHHDGGVAATVEHFLQAQAQGTELAALRVGILHQERALGEDDGSEAGGVAAGHDDHQVGDRREHVDGAAEEGAAVPGEQGLVRSHARRLTRRQDDSAKAGRSRHG